MAAPRRTYIVSVYEDGEPVLVQDVARDERTRLENLDSELPACIRDWERTALTDFIDPSLPPHDCAVAGGGHRTLSSPGPVHTPPT